MRIHALLLAACVCAHHARAASIPLDLDNVDLDDDHPNVVDKLRTEGIPVRVVEEPVLDENSNDYIPPYDISANVKRIEVDLENPGPPQRQEHETQNQPTENFSDNDKIVVSIKHSIKQAENVFNEGLQHVSDSFKTFLQADEDLPLIQQNIKNLKETFTGQFEKLNETIRSYLPPETASTNDGAVNPKLEMIQAHLKFLDTNFKRGVDTLTEGVEVYSIIKEEDEAEKALSLKADIKAEPGVAPSVPAEAPSKPVVNPPAQPSPTNPATATPAPWFPWDQYLQEFQNNISNTFQSITNIFTGNNNGQNAIAQPTNPILNVFQNVFQGQNTVSQQPPAAADKPTNPANTQADPVPQATPAPWSPGAILQSVQNTWNNIVNPGQNNQPAVQTTPQPLNPFQQVYQNFVSFITPQTPQAQQPANPANTNPAVAVSPEKAPPSAPVNKPEAAVPVQGTNAVPAPVHEKPQADPVNEQPPAAPVHDQPQALPEQAVNPAPAQANPIQQMVQNNPIIKGIQSAVQRLQGTPNPETPREETILEDQNKEETADPKGHYHGGHNNVSNQGDSSDSGRVEDKIMEKAPEIPTDEKEVPAEQLLKAEPNGF